MYYVLTRVIMRGMGRVSRRQSLAMLGSWRLISRRPVRVELHQGVGPLPQCTAAGSGQRLVPLCTGSLPR
jgi:hypothetical protein